MRPYSISQIRRGWKDTRKKIPREGTLTRDIYDSLISSGEVVIKGDNVEYSAIEYLRNFYGMDIYREARHVYRYTG